MRCTLILFSLLLVLFLAGPAAARSLDFVVIQPGQPGTAQEAQPVMDALAAYIQGKMEPGITVHGVYINEVSNALDFIRKTPPQWGVVSYPFFAVHAREFAMTPLASSRPGGHGKDRWTLLVSRDRTDWRTLTGPVQGTMLFEPVPAACFLFERLPEELSFTLEGTRTPLQALRAVSRGTAAGIVVDRLQHEAFRALPAAAELKEIASSPEIPTSPVVWFGETDERTERLQRILLGMREDPEAADLLLLLQAEGFGPADLDLLEGKFDDARCPR